MPYILPLARVFFIVRDWGGMSFFFFVFVVLGSSGVGTQGVQALIRRQYFYITKNESRLEFGGDAVAFVDSLIKILRQFSQLFLRYCTCPPTAVEGTSIPYLSSLLVSLSTMQPCVPMDETLGGVL